MENRIRQITAKKRNAYLLERIEKDEAILAYRETQLPNMSKDQVSDHNKRKAKLKAEKEKLLGKRK